jgi:hypothetical protein
MRIVPELDHKIRREIRDARAKDPLVSVVALQEQLEKQFNRTFSRKYITKLAFKVERQAEAAAGMYKKPLEVLASEVHYESLPGEVRAIVIAAWQRGGLLPKPLVELMVPAVERME